MTLTPGQTQTVERAMDALDGMRESAQRPVEYIIDQLVNGASPEYHGGQRPEREDASFLCDLLKTYLPRELSVDNAA